MKRFEPCSVTGEEWPAAEMIEDNLGDWVRYSDAQAKIKQLQIRNRQAINLMGAAVFDRGQAVQILTDIIDFFGDVTMGQVGVEKFSTGSNLIKQAKAIIKKADADTAHNAEFERIQTAAKRYETLRTLNPRQFADLYAKNLETGTPFDELVDQIVKESK